jgi:uncharacterized protein YndB with AHSA1/START domain
MTDLIYRLDRQLVIRARPDVVFTFFTDSSRWAAWWGAGSAIDARPGGRMLIRHPNGVEASGEVLEVREPERFVFTYGMAGRKPGPPGSTRVTILLHPHPNGTLLRLSHEFAEAESRDEHVQGWRYQLSLFANLVAATVNANAADLVDQWCAAWSDPDEASRNQVLTDIAAPGIRVADRFSSVEGLDDLRAHLAAVHRFMPGIRMERRGLVRQCQGYVLADWHAVGSDGTPRGTGTNVFVIDANGRFSEVTGFWGG